MKYYNVKNQNGELIKRKVTMSLDTFLVSMAIGVPATVCYFVYLAVAC